MHRLWDWSEHDSQRGDARPVYKEAEQRRLLRGHLVGKAEHQRDVHLKQRNQIGVDIPGLMLAPPPEGLGLAEAQAR